MDAQQTITRFIHNASVDSPDLPGKLFPIVYEELRRLAVRMMAKLPRNQTLQPMALVDEAYVRLVAIDDSDWKSRQRFFRTAARAMRSILVDQARRKATAKHGRRVSDQDPEQLSIECATPPEELLALNEALDDLERERPRQARLVELRFFAGLTEAEAAEVLRLSTRSVAREWRHARFWSYHKIAGTGGKPGS